MDIWSYILIICFSIIAYGIFHDRDRLNSLRDGTGLIIWGMEFLIVGLLFSGFTDNHFDIDSVLRFLTLDKTQEDYFNKSRAVIFAYLFILTGIEICIIVVLKKYNILSQQVKNRTDNHNAEANHIHSSTVDNHKDITRVYVDEFYNTSCLLKVSAGVIACTPLLFVYAFFSFWKTYDYVIDMQIILFLIMSVTFGLIPLGILLLFRKYVSVTVTTRPDGLSVRGIFMNFSARWDEVKNIDTGELMIGDIAHVITEKGDFYFRPTMKSRNNKLPNLVRGFTGKPLKWVMPDGGEKAVSFENCDLYKKILRHARLG